MHELRISNAALGRALGVSGQMAGKYRSGAVPSADKIPALADALGVSESELTSEITRTVGDAAVRSTSGTPRPSITDLLDDPERTRGATDGLVAVGGGLVAEGYDADGLMYAVEIVFHIRPDPRRTTHTMRPAEALSRAETGSVPRGPASTGATREAA